MTYPLGVIPMQQSTERKKRKKAPAERIRDLVEVGLIGSDAGGNQVIKVTPFPVSTPRGEAALARSLCDQHGCARVLLGFSDGYVSERRRSGDRVAKLTPMAVYLRASFKSGG